METALSRLAANCTVRQSTFYHNQLINPSASTLCWVDKPQQPQGLAPPASRRLPSVSLSGYRCSLLGSREQESNFPPTAIDSPLHSLNIKLSAPPLGFLPALLCVHATFSKCILASVCITTPWDFLVQSTACILEVALYKYRNDLVFTV